MNNGIDNEELKERIRCSLIQLRKLEEKNDKMDNSIHNIFREQFYEIDALKFELNYIAEVLGMEERA